MQYLDFEQREAHKNKTLVEQVAQLKKDLLATKLVVEPLKDLVFQKDERLKVVEIQNKKLMDEIDVLKAQARNTTYEPSL